MRPWEGWSSPLTAGDSARGLGVSKRQGWGAIKQKSAREKEKNGAKGKRNGKTSHKILNLFLLYSSCVGKKNDFFPKATRRLTRGEERQDEREGADEHPRQGVDNGELLKDDRGVVKGGEEGDVSVPNPRGVLDEQVGESIVKLQPTNIAELHFIVRRDFAGEGLRLGRVEEDAILLPKLGVLFGLRVNVGGL